MIRAFSKRLLPLVAIACTACTHEITARGWRNTYQGSINSDGIATIIIEGTKFTTKINERYDRVVALSSPNGQWLKCSLRPRDYSGQSGECSTNQYAAYGNWWSSNDAPMEFIVSELNSKYETYTGELNRLTNQAHLDIKGKHYSGKLQGTWNMFDGVLNAMDGSFLRCHFDTAGNGDGIGTCMNQEGNKYELDWKRGFHM